MRHQLSPHTKQFIRCCWLAGIDADEMFGMTRQNRQPYADEVLAVRMEFARLNKQLEEAEEFHL